MRRAALLLFAVLFAVPSFAAISHDLTVPVTGLIQLPERDLVYLTELTITNHRDVEQRFLIHVIDDLQPDDIVYETRLGPKETLFRAGNRNGGWYGMINRLVALRFVAVDSIRRPDSKGQLEVRTFVVAERGRFGLSGQSRQEIEAVPSSDYLVPENKFIGLRHDLPTYTNVGVVNLHETETVTYSILFQFYDEPVVVSVPPLASRQIRLPGDGNAGRRLTITPDWAATGATPKPWVTYASTVDGYTGDAHSAHRLPPGTKLR